MATGEAADDTGLRRIKRDAGDGPAMSLLMVSFLVFLDVDDDGKAGTASRGVSGKEGKGWVEETSDEASGVSGLDVTEGRRSSSMS